MAAVLAGTALGVWVLVPEDRAPKGPVQGRDVAQEPLSEHVPASPATSSRALEPAVDPSSVADRGHQPSSDPPTPAQRAFEAHARRAEVWWTDSASVLRQAHPQHYADAADEFAARMRSVGPQTPAPVVQEIIHEEQQFLNLLRRRYSEIPPLMDLVEQLEGDLKAVQEQITAVGPSPDPQTRSPSRGDGFDHP